MKKRILSFLTALLIIGSKAAISQSWIEKMQDPAVNFYDVQKAFNDKYHEQEKEMLRERYKEFKTKQALLNKAAAKGIKAPKGSEAATAGEEKEGEIPGWEIYKRWEDYMKPRLYPSGDRSVMINAMNDYLTNFYNNNNASGGSMRAMSGGTTPTVQAANWSLVGPSTSIPSGGGAGRVNFVRFDPSNTNIIWVGSPDGGLWKSTNGGTSWATNTDNLPLLGCSDLAINSLNNQVMYLATGDGDASDTYSLGVLKSTDGGATWNTTGLNWLVTNGRNISRLLINPANPNTIFAATSNGVYRSVNAGGAWTQIATAVANVKDIEYRPGDTTTIYAASTTKFFKSTNGGTTFTNITAGLPATTLVDRLAIAVTAANPAYVYVLASLATDDGFQGLYRSIDNGTTFTTRSTSPNVLGWASAGNDTGGQGWYDLSIAAAPTNANFIVVGGVNTWKSSDGGSTWSLDSHWTGSGAPYVHADCHALEFIPGSGTTYFAGVDGGCFKTTTTGASFTDLSNGLQISQPYRLGLSATNTNLLVTGFQDNGTNRWNGTATWNYIQGGDGMEAIVDWSNANVQYGELYYGQINRTTTGGNLNTSIVSSGGTGVNANGDWVTPYIMNPQKASTLIVGKAQAYRSMNRGTSWAALGTVTGGTGNLVALAYAPADSNYLYVAKTDKLFVSTNSGTSFTDRTGTLPVGSAAITYIAVANNNPAHVWVTFSGYSAANKVWYSADAGVTWTNYSTGLPNLPANCIVYQNGSANDALYCGTDVGVYYRDNTAGSWAPYSTGLPNVIVKELEIQYTAAKLRAATFGRGIWQSDLATPGTSPPVADFSANRTNICIGDCINFTDLSTGTPTSWSWSFPGAATATSTIQNPTNICYNTAGTYNVTLTATNVNGSSPVTKTAYITVSGTIALPLVEGFQATFVPAGWFLNNPDADNTWAQTATAGGFGTSTQSALMDNYSPATSIVGTIDELVTPKYSFAGLSSAQMTFDVAYARYNTTYMDSLIVYVSTNCGVSWTQVYSKGGFTGLQTAPDNATSMFVPTAAQWRTETVNMTPYVGQSNVSVKFTSRSGWGQALYLDNINITGAGGAVASVSIAETTGTNPMCAGASATFTATPTNGGTTPAYQWQVNGSNVGTNSPTYTTATLTNGQVVTCIMTSNLAGVTGSPATSNSITMTVNPVPATPAPTSNSPVCAGSAINLFTTTVAGATYSWTGPSAFTSAAQNPTRAGATAAMAGTYSVTVSAGGCTSPAGTITVTVNPLPVAPAAGSNSPVCAGSAINLTSTAVAGATYSWSGPGAYASAVQNPSRAGATAAMAGTYSVTITTGGCTSAAATTTVIVNPVPATPTAGSNTPVCTGSTINLTTPVLSGATYSWSGPSAFTSTVQNASRPSATAAMAGTYSVTVTVGGCTSLPGTTAVTVNSSVTPTVSVSQTAGTNPMCAGSAATFTAAQTGGGVTPAYQWQVNGLNVGTNSPAYSSTGLTNGQTVTVTMTSSSGCASPASVTSTAITMTVNPVPFAPAAGSNTPVCSGNTINLTTGTVTGATYSWTGPNAFSASVQNPSTAASTAAMAGTYSVTVTVSGCTSPSATAVVAVNSTVTPSVSIAQTTGTNPMCAGASSTFTVNPTNGGATPVYQWMLNGSNVGTGGSTYTTTSLADGDVISCSLTSNAACASPASTSSNSITMSVTTSVTPSVTISASPSGAVCQGDPVTFTAADLNGGTTPSYQWQVNGSNAGTNSATFNPASLNNGDVVTCTLTSSSTCATSATANSNSITATVNATPATPTITLAGSTLTSSASAGNQWYLNGSPIAGATGQSYTFTTNGNYTVVVTSGGCSSGSSAVMSITNVGIIDTSAANGMLSVYPNPNDGNFTLSFYSAEKTSYKVIISNAIGQLVYKEELKDFSGSYSKELSVVEYGKGVYTVSLTNSKNETVKKIIVY